MAFRRNVLWNLMGNGLPLVAAAVAFPILNTRLGTERFGVVTLIWTLIGFLSFFDLGLGRALTQIMAKNSASGEVEENMDVLRTGITFTLITGLIGGGVFLATASPMAGKWLKISAAFEVDVRNALLLTGVAVPMVTVSAAMRGALEGAERFMDVNIARIFLGMSSFLFPVLFIVFFRSTLVVVVVSLVVSRALTLILFIWALKRGYPDFRWHLKTNNKHGKRLLGFGLWMTLSNIVSPLLVYSDRFIISGTLGASLVAFYTVPFEIMVRLQILPGAIGSTLFPRLSSLFGADRSAAVALVRRSAAITTLIMVLLVGMVLLAYRPVVSHWMGPMVADRSFPIAIALGIGSIINGGSNVIYTAVQAEGGARPTGLLHLVELIVYFPLLLMMVKFYGLQGAAWIWAVRVLLDFLFLTGLFLRGNLLAIGHSQGHKN